MSMKLKKGCETCVHGDKSLKDKEGTMCVSCLKGNTRHKKAGKNIMKRRGIIEVDGKFKFEKGE